MTTAPKTSTLIVTVPTRLTNEQVAAIRSQIEPHLPADAGLIVLHSGLTGQVVGRATLRRWNSKRRPLNRSAKVTP